MPRSEIKPFYRKFTKSYYVQIDGKQINLGRDKKAAYAKCRELLRSKQALNAAATSVQGLIAQYLDWCSKHRSEATYSGARFYLSSFAGSISAQLKVEDVKPQHVTDWIEKATTWSSTSKHDAITHVQRVFSWAIKNRILEHHPLQHIEGKPPRRRREIYYRPDEWESVLAQVRDENFRDYLAFTDETGCRPFEVRIIEARHCDLRHSLVVFDTEESKGELYRRTIVLTEKAREICARLSKKHPRGPIFRNTKGRPWTKDSVNCRFQRLKRKVGVKKLCAYGIRHTFATDALLNGVDSTVLAELMGHKDRTMVARTYQHVAKDISFLRDAANRAKGRDA